MWYSPKTDFSILGEGGTAKIAMSNASQAHTFYNNDLKMVQFKDFGQTVTNESRNTPILK